MTKTKNIKIPSSNSRWNRWHVVKQRLYLINVLDTQCTIPVLAIVFLNISLNHAGPCEYQAIYSISFCMRKLLEIIFMTRPQSSHHHIIIIIISSSPSSSYHRHYHKPVRFITVSGLVIIVFHFALSSTTFMSIPPTRNPLISLSSSLSVFYLFSLFPTPIWWCHPHFVSSHVYTAIPLQSILV